MVYPEAAFGVILRSALALADTIQNRQVMAERRETLAASKGSQRDDIFLASNQLVSLFLAVHY